MCHKSKHKFSHKKTRYKILFFFSQNYFTKNIIMSDNFQSTKAFGKCFYIENGDRCGCQRFIALRDNERSCEACLHHSSYHEDLVNDINRSNNRIPTFGTNSLSNNQNIKPVAYREST
jgi:hypothetical protein